MGEEQEPSLWLLQEVTGEAGYAGLGLAGVSYSSRLWGSGSVRCGRVPDPGVLGSGGQWPGV